MLVVAPKVVEILGVGLHRLSMGDLIREATQRARAGAKTTILYANVHTLNTAYSDPELRRILNQADLVYCDGAGVVLGARLLGHRLPGRMTGADWIDPLCEVCAKDETALYFLGGQPGVAARAAELLCSRYPGLRVVGTHHGYLHPSSPLVPSPNFGGGSGRGQRGEEGRGGGGISAAAIAAINAARPHILLVGMGTPTQEKWLAAHRHQLEVPVVWAVGALFDFVAGVQPRGPRWMLDHGLEWLCRLLSDPARLWRRYLIGNPLFILRVLRQRCAR